MIGGWDARLFCSISEPEEEITGKHTRHTNSDHILRSSDSARENIVFVSAQQVNCKLQTPCSGNHSAN